MPPKKKGEEEALAPEESLPEGYSLGCEVYWVGNSIHFDDGDVLKCGEKRTLAHVHELADPKRGVEFVDVELEGARRKVPFENLSLEPPPPEKLDELPSGLKLDLTGEQVMRIWEAAPDAEAQAQLVNELMGLDEAFPDPEQCSIASDFQLLNLVQVRTLGFTPLQAATLVTIMWKVLQRARNTTPSQERSPADFCSTSECFQDFQQLLIQHAHEDPPASCGIFSPAEAKKLIDYASTTLFKHFLLYQFCLSASRDSLRLRISTDIERPPAPLDLNAARLVRAPKDEDLDLSLPKQEEAAEEPSEAEEIERLVREKLRVTELALQAKLQEREKAFTAKLEAAKPKAKGKK